MARTAFSTVAFAAVALRSNTTPSSFSISVTISFATNSALFFNALSLATSTSYASQHPTETPPVSWSDVATTNASFRAATYSTARLKARSYAHISPMTAPASLACAPWSMRPASTSRKNPSSFSCSANFASRTASAASSIATSEGASASPRDGVAPFANPARLSSCASISYARCESANRPSTRGPNCLFAKGAAVEEFSDASPLS
mmetsp:Transcript_5926/g.24013  ORF Transcript_5926/g.24013 Transcript_5926/m.24013 type:complete len:205 (+) Transcript_5926:500-1114(+)